MGKTHRHLALKIATQSIAPTNGLIKKIRNDEKIKVAIKKIGIWPLNLLIYKPLKQTARLQTERFFLIRIYISQIGRVRLMQCWIFFL